MTIVWPTSVHGQPLRHFATSRAQAPTSQAAGSRQSLFRQAHTWHYHLDAGLLSKLNAMTSRARLEDVPSLASEILDGKTRGRVVIDL